MVLLCWQRRNLLEGAVELWVACVGMAPRPLAIELAGVETEGTVEVRAACIGVMPQTMLVEYTPLCVCMLQYNFRFTGVGTITERFHYQFIGELEEIENTWPRVHNVCIAQYTVGWLEERNEHTF